MPMRKPMPPFHSPSYAEPSVARRRLASRRLFLLGLCACMGMVLGACRRAPALPTLGDIVEFHLQDQEGRDFSPGKLRGRVWVAAFMFTRCPSICPRITKQMHELQLVTQARKLPVHFVSISVDPENDTPAVLRKYGEKYGADFSSWSFVTGDYSVIRRTSVEGFKLALEGKADAKKEHLGILHGSHLVLVDGKAKIRGYYRTSDKESMQQLLVDAAQLVAD
ncbi:MAG: SCO family protein [Polyangiaceae bacterium]|nr:SCO family protein [Polyangiaceae bacterium]